MRTLASTAMATAALLVGMAIGLIAYHHGRSWLESEDGAGGSGGPGGGAIPVTIETVTIGDLPLIYETLGSLRSPRRVALRPAEAGIVRAVHIEDGQRVGAGDPILQLDDERERATVAVAAAERDEAARQLQVAQRLTAGKTIAEDEIERLQAALAAAEARVNLAQAQLARRRLEAPFAGHCDLVRVELGATVDPGTLVTNLVQLDPLRISAAIPERYLLRLGQQDRAGDTMALEAVLADGEAVAARLVYTAPSLDVASRSLPVEAELPNSEELLRAGMSLDVRVQLAAQADVVSVPEEAVVFEGNRSFVYVVADKDDLPEGAVGVALPRDLQLGSRADGRVVVEAGLEAGERVVVRGVQKIFFPGMPVADAAAMPPPAAGGPPEAGGPPDQGAKSDAAAAPPAAGEQVDGG